MSFLSGLIVGLFLCAIVIVVAIRLHYVNLTKGDRADKVDDDLKAARDKVFRETP